MTTLYIYIYTYTYIYIYIYIYIDTSKATLTFRQKLYRPLLQLSLRDI